MKKERIKTHEEVRQDFRDAGISIKEWAEKNNFPPAVVYTLLNSRRPAVRGASHAAAVKLGIKPAGRQVGR